MVDSAAAGCALIPARAETSPSCMAPPSESPRSSQCWITVSPSPRAYSSARRISPPLLTGRPSSETATQPASFSSPISARHSPASPRVIAPMG